MKTFTTTNGQKIQRVSRWIKVNTAYNITERHSLFYYAEQFDENENMLDYFIHKGKKYAINQFYRFNTMFNPSVAPTFYENNEPTRIAGYDSENYYNPILIELSECGEAVRVYQEVTV